MTIAFSIIKFRKFVIKFFVSIAIFSLSSVTFAEYESKNPSLNISPQINYPQTSSPQSDSPQASSPQTNSTQISSPQTDSQQNSFLSVGPQYDTTHVYVDPEDFDDFINSFVATFGGTTSKQGVFQVTPTPSQTMIQMALTPVGTISVFGFKTPIPYPFGEERSGYLVTDLDKAVAAARRAGADVIVTPFPDPIGRDVIIQWPGGVNMQLYWHTTAPSYPPLKTIPENRVYVSKDRADNFIQAFINFSGGKVVSDEANAPGIEIGREIDSYRRVRIESGFGKMQVMVTDGHLPWPYGQEITGYEVTDIQETLAKAKAAEVKILIDPFKSDDRISSIIQFPGGYIAEIHAVSSAPVSPASPVSKVAPSSDKKNNFEGM